MKIYGPDGKMGMVKERLDVMLRSATPGSRLSPERDLCALFNVSRTTIRRAMEELITEGRLHRVPGGGVYVTNMPAQDTLTLGLLYGGEAIHEPFIGTILRRYELEVAARGHRLLPILSPSQDDKPSLPHPVDGLILACARNADNLPAGLPAAVALIPYYFLASATFVLVDDILGGMTAAQHLIRLGHRRLAMVGNSLQWSNERYQGACRAAAEAGLPAPRLVSTANAPVTPEVVEPIVVHGDTGVICANDEIAMATIACLHKLGAHVPEEVSVIGFDDLPTSVNFAPPLTTIRMPVDRIVTTVLDELEQYIRQRETYFPKRIMVPMELVERGSCRPVVMEQVMR